MTINLPKPQPKQIEFLTANTRYVGFGGARGGGKSWAVRFKAQLLAMRYAGIRMLLLRRTFPELEGNHIKPLIADTHSYAQYRDKDKTLTFVNGSTLRFGYCDSENDVQQYQGQEYDVIFFDEATQFTEYMFDCIKACNRGANNFPKRIYFTCNPGGPGHGWVKRLFIDKDYRQGERAEDYTFIRSLVYDNQALLNADPDYLRTLEALPDDLRKAWLDGDWDIFAGQFFTEFRKDVHVVTPREIPAHWTRVIALDYGLDMLAVLWGAFDETGRGMIYKELCRSQLPVEDACEAILAMCTPEEVNIRHDSRGQEVQTVTVYAPPDLWNRTVDSGVSVAEQFRQHGVIFLKADNNRQNGWMNVKTWLHGEEDGGGKVTPRLQFFSTCPEVVRCLPLLQFAKNNSMDCATEPHDITHAPDALRYLIQSRPRAAKTPDTRSDAERRADEMKKYKESRLSGGDSSGRPRVLRR